MSVVTSIYNCFKYDLLDKATSWTGDTIKCALMAASTFDAANTAYVSTGGEGTEASGTGYTTGGIDVSTKTKSTAATSPNLCKITGAAGGGAAGTTTWTITDTLSAVAAKLYSTTNANRVIAHIDFGATLVASGGGTFTITWDATNGVFKLA
jgi:hypothetical protein